MRQPYLGLVTSEPLTPTPATETNRQKPPPTPSVPASPVPGVGAPAVPGSPTPSASASPIPDLAASAAPAPPSASASSAPAVPRAAASPPAPPRPATSDPPAPVRRRRGAALEEALLEAAWDELRAVGYPRLTLDGVAARAGTSRPVLARRWTNRAELVIAAIRHQHPAAAPVPPDTGTLREDVLTLLRQMSAAVGEIAGVLTFVFADYFGATGRPPAEIRQQAIAAEGSMMAVVIERAIERGEIDPGGLTPRLAALPVDLVRHDLIMNQAPVPDEALIEIVDQIFLPLVNPVAVRNAPPVPSGT
jgi:AcrR family transcriptional regulator